MEKKIELTISEYNYLRNEIDELRKNNDRLHEHIAAMQPDSLRKKVEDLANRALVRMIATIAQKLGYKYDGNTPFIEQDYVCYGLRRNTNDWWKDPNCPIEVRVNVKFADIIQKRLQLVIHHHADELEKSDSFWQDNSLETNNEQPTTAN